MPNRYIIIETIDREWPNIMLDIDGKPLIFNNKPEAEKEAENCHAPLIVRI
ncbi:MAG: hypothetical protein ACOC33_00625 [bacterium]